MLIGAATLASAALALSPLPAHLGASPDRSPLLAVPAAAAPLSVAPAGSPLAPDLAGLEQRMLLLQPTSVQLGLAETVYGAANPRGPLGPFNPTGKAARHPPPARAAASFTLLSLTGAIGFAPPVENLGGSFLGLQIATRQIATTRWSYLALLGELDHKRPWVEEPGQPLVSGSKVGEQAFVGAPTGAAGPPGGMFAGIVAELDAIGSAQELGAQTVDGQATIEFAGSLALSRVPSLTAAKRRTLRRVTKGPLRVQVYVAEDGLPVRTLVAITIGMRGHHLPLTVQLDLPAIDLPVLVSPPPPSETITKAALQRLFSPPRPSHRHRAPANRHG